LRFFPPETYSTILRFSSSLRKFFAMLKRMLRREATIEGVKTFSPFNSPITFLLFMSGIVIPRFFFAWGAPVFSFSFASLGVFVFVICFSDLFFFPPPNVYSPSF